MSLEFGSVIRFLTDISGYSNIRIEQIQNFGYPDNPTDIQILSVGSNSGQIYSAGQNYYLKFSFFGNNVTQTLKKEFLKNIFYGTAIAKKGNDRHT